MIIPRRFDLRERPRYPLECWGIVSLRLFKCDDAAFELFKGGCGKA